MAPVRAAVRAALNSTLSTRCFGIEYGGFMSNHLAHGVVALEVLSSESPKTTEHVADTWVGQYIQDTLEPADSAQRAEGALAPIGEGEAADLLGKRERFYGLVDYYGRQVELTGLQATIQEHLPKLCGGVAGSAFHGAIQLGYGVFAGADRVAVEGLAYLHHSHLAFATDEVLEAAEGRAQASGFAEFRSSFRSALVAVASDTELRERAASGEASFAQLATSPFQRRMLALAQSPSQLDRPCSSVLLAPLGWFVDAMLEVFLETSDAATWDFFLLHGVTSAWALEQASATLNDTARARVSAGLAHAIAATYVAQGCPELRAATGTHDEVNLASESWESICSRVANSSSDEHVFKLAQVAMLRSRAADSALEDRIFKLAAARALHGSMRFGPPQQRAEPGA